MFVFESTHQKALKDAEYTRIQLHLLSNKWGDLVDRINALGGEDFLQNAKIGGGDDTPLTKDELRQLIILCHPDKHQGSRVANDMTARLLSLREQKS